MKQVLQNLRSGATEIIETPKPQVKPGHVLIRTYSSLISAGTERMLVDFGKANFINKARQQPEKVQMVLDKVKTDGLMTTIEAVKNKLDTPLPMGYCNVGEIIELGSNVHDFALGDLVVSNGPHAELVVVPKNLCAKVPTNVDIESASFAILGAISLQGIRLLQPTLAEAFVVTGMGLLGLLAVQLLRASGCKVLALDYDANRLKLAQQFGAEIVNLANGEDPLKAAEKFSQGRGVDGVLLTASTQSNEPMQQAAHMCRKRGRIVLVGTTGLELSRADFYEKELSFQVSCSYGPGRYDKTYEEQGIDYPFGHVRWTEQRNIEAVLEMLASGRLVTPPLISHHFLLAQAKDAYQLISDKTPSLGILLKYSEPAVIPHAELMASTITNTNSLRGANSANPTIRTGFIGAGNYATQVLIPAFQKNSAALLAIASQTGISAAYVGKKFGINKISSNNHDLLTDPDVNTIVITTRHNTHAELVCQALNNGKHVFVEKPLALTQIELDEIAAVYSAKSTSFCPILMVGFNRRFAPQVIKMKSLLQSCNEPKTIIMTINAGPIPDDHWTQNPTVGGGRIIGEACHFIDLMRHLTDATITSIQVTKIGRSGHSKLRDDKATITLGFADGSFGVIHYLANGHKSFPKERIEVFCAGKILQLDNFIKLQGYGWRNFKKMNLWRQNKGQIECTKSFIQAIKNDTPPIPFAELMEVSRKTIEISEAIQQCD